MSSSTAPAFGPTCPSGGSWFACSAGTTFAGCCSTNSDPCSTTCAQGDLRSAGFNPAFAGKFPNASCEKGSSFWTCVYPSRSTFMGCCKSDPCKSGGCLGNDLTAAYLNSSDLISAYGAVSASSSSSIGGLSSTLSTGTTITGSLTTTTSVPEKSTTAATLAPVASEPQKQPIAAIAGGTVGGVFALAVVIGLFIYYFCHARRSREGHGASLEDRRSSLLDMAMTKEKHGETQPSEPLSHVSPNPDDYYNLHASHHYQQHSYHQSVTGPQELPEQPHSPGRLSRQPAMLQQHNMSELSGNPTVRVELESPYVR